jgi:hypothetical protein
MHEAANGFTTLFEDVRVARFDFLLGLWIDLRISQGCTVIWRALEDREVANFLGDFRNQLDGSGACADDTDALAGEVYAFMWPPGRMERLPFKALNPCNVG